MSDKNLSENVKSFAAKKVLAYLNDDPDKALPKILDWLRKFDKSSEIERQLDAVSNVLNNPDSNWYRLVKSLWTDIDDGVRATMFENFVINSANHRPGTPGKVQGTV